MKKSWTGRCGRANGGSALRTVIVLVLLAGTAAVVLVLALGKTDHPPFPTENTPVIPSMPNPSTATSGDAPSSSPGIPDVTPHVTPHVTPDATSDAETVPLTKPPKKREMTAADAPKRAEMEALIERLGQTPPEWWDSVPLRYLKTLDLRWNVTKGPWNTRKNLSQYLWSVINENPSRWREGVKLLHHVLNLNKDDSRRAKKTFVALAYSYQRLLKDYARAAYWWLKAEEGHDLDLAFCYWKLGSKAMAVDALEAYGPDFTNNGAVIKLWADMGELTTALALAEKKATDDYWRPDLAHLAAGDACRLSGKLPEALSYYRKVLALREGSRRLKNNKRRARANINAIKVFDMADPKRVRDGSYLGESIAYAGILQVEVTVKTGRIESVKVVKHKEKQFFTALTDTPGQIVRKQSVKGIDTVTGATITSEAIINAAAKALASGAE